MKNNKTYLLLIIIVFLWNLLIILPPLLKTLLPGLSIFLYSVFNHICHQFDSRSLHIFGEKLGVCARCWGIYFGFFVGTLLYTPKNINNQSFSKYIFLVASIPILIDISLDISSIHESNLTTKVVSGFIFGSIVASKILITLNEAIIGLINKRRKKCTKNQTNLLRHFMAE